MGDRMDMETVIKKLRRYYAYALTKNFIRKPLAWTLYQLWKEAEGIQ